MYAGRFTTKGKTTFELGKNESAWIQIARGEMTVNGETFTAGDGAAIEKISFLGIEANSQAEILLFHFPSGKVP